MYFKVLITYSIFAINLIPCVHAGECSKDEILQMIKGGLKANQIEKICKDTLHEPNPYCCCEIASFKIDRYLDENKVEQVRKIVYGKKYRWVKASECLDLSGPRKPGEIIGSPESFCISDKTKCGQ